MRRLGLVGLALFIASGVAVGACTAAAFEAATNPAPPQPPPADRRVGSCEVNTSDKGTEVIDRDAGFGVLLPGRGWRFRCPGVDGSLLEGEQPGKVVLLNIDIGRFVLPDPSEFSERGFLDLAFAKAAEGATNAGGTVGKHSIVDINGRLVLFLPVQIAGHEQLLNVQVIRAVQAENGEIYFLHLGWSSAAAAWTKLEADRLAKTAVRFGVLGDGGDGGDED
jgi:hypothetical protein